jgi:hypothetical protein
MHKIATRDRGGSDDDIYIHLIVKHPLSTKDGSKKKLERIFSSLNSEQ